MRDLAAGGHVYVCGGTRMGMDVMEAIVGVAMSQCQQEGTMMTKEQAVEFVKELKSKGRYVQELWS